MTLPVVDFTTNDAGADVGTAVCAADTPLTVGSQLSINGSTDLTKIIVGPDSAYISAISLGGATGIWEYGLSVTGQGPSGAGSGSLEITIIDQGGGSHSLKLNSSTNKTHVLGYSSPNPAINTISWDHGRV